MKQLTKFGVVTDEIDPNNLESALTVMKDLGISYADLNTVEGKNISNHSKDEVYQIKQLLDQYEVKPMLLSTPFIKGITLDEISKNEIASHPEFLSHMEILRNTIEIAHILEAPMVRTFSFRRPPTYTPPLGGEIDNNTFEKIVEGLQVACCVAEEEGVQLALENANSCWGNTGHNMSRIIREVNSPALGAVWDVANAFVSGEQAYPDGYQKVKDYILHVHVKDAKILDPAASKTAWECMGRGEISYKEQFKALADDGYDGVITLETHWHPDKTQREQSTRMSFEGLLELIKLSDK